MFEHNAFDACPRKIPSMKFKIFDKISVRNAVTALSIGGGQGMLICNSGTQCATNRCS
jgi:hypothetical protein